MDRAYQSPFLDSELFVSEPDVRRARRADALVAGSPFLDALTPGDATLHEGEASADDGQVEEAWRESGEFVDEHVEPENESYDREQAPDEESAPDEDGGELFEQFAPVVSQADLRARIDDYFAAAEVEYTLPAGGTVRARSQFTYSKRPNLDKLRSTLERTLGGAFERKHPRAIHNTVYGRPRLEQLAAVTQALIDAGKFEAVKKAHPLLTDVQVLRRMQLDFGVGIDCAGYVQLAFIHAFMGSDADSPAVRRSLGLKEKRGDERLESLPTSHFKKVSIADVETGDLLVLDPRAGARDRAMHTVIIFEHAVSGDEHAFIGDASWGTEAYGHDAGGIQRRTLMHDAATGEWWDINPLTGADEPRNAVGPYGKHKLKGFFRAVQKAPAAKAKPGTTMELEATEDETGPHPECSKSGRGIHGDDDRRRVTNPLEIPSRWICQIWARRRDSDGNVTVTGATGVLISPRHVLTVAHLVCDGERKNGRWIINDATQIRVSPARDGDDRPLGTYEAKLPARVAHGWTARGMAAPFDYALLTLEKPIGNEAFKRLGGRKLFYWGSNAGGGGTSVRAAAPSQLEGRTAVTAGYPKDRGNGEVPHITSGQLANVRADRALMDFSADACQGQSGSPVWVDVGGRHCLVGIMRSVGETSNTVLRISDAICAQLRQWMGSESDACLPAPVSGRELSDELEHEDDAAGLLEVEGEEPEGFQVELEEEDSAAELIAADDDFVDEAAALEADEAALEIEQQVRPLDPALLDLAERVARGRPAIEHDTPQKFSRCFPRADIDRVSKVYEDNATAARSDSGDRCSCIVMLNVALGQLLNLRIKSARARGTSDRRVDMGALSTESIEKSMAQVRAAGRALAPVETDFLDARGRTAGTLRPKKLKASVQARVIKASPTEGCWFAYGMSVMDGYHSVLLLVDHTGQDPKIFWLDQFSTGVTDDVTSTLDTRLTDMTQGWWDSVKAAKNKGYDTVIRLWPLGTRK